MKAKFENLLTTLFFIQTTVHLKTEYSSVETASWNIDLSKYSVKHDNSTPEKMAKEY
jgi:hypothetical protein